MTGDVNDVMHRKRARRILGDLKKSVVESCGPKKKGCFRLLAEALRRGRMSWGGRCKNQNRKNGYLSPYVEEPLNSKVIKSFVPELRSRKCFSCFGIPMFYVYMLWTFYVRFTYPYLDMLQYDNMRITRIFFFSFIALLTKLRIRWLYPLQ